MGDQIRNQLVALSHIHSLLTTAGIPYWVFGGWAVDLYAGRITRKHQDIDVVVYLTDLERAMSCLIKDGWSRRLEHDSSGYFAFVRDELRLEIAFAARAQDGGSDWGAGALAEDVGRVEGVEARVVSLSALIADKSEDYGDPDTLAKDRADLEVLSRIRQKADS
ncbi:MAG TPA: hypothetical protein VFY10_01595 [Dehalococcoidia bacterium]|nr:hypothetical protein [Dehalococcoidia bacterium]